MEKLTLSRDGAVIRRAKHYAAARQTSMSRLVESLLDRLTAHDADAPPPRGAQGMATFSMMSLTTASVVRPWLAAWGPSQMRWPSTYWARS